jgi:hypothetical protein
MSDEETYGLDDELPPWADEVHGLPDEAEVGDDDEDPVADQFALDEPPFFDAGPGPELAFDEPFGDRPAMSRPSAGIGLLDTGVAKWFSQRPKPFTNCMFAALCSTLTYMGYDVPRSFVNDLRQASGVDAKKATSMAHTTKAMRKLMPEADIRSGKMSDDELKKRLSTGEICARVMVRNQDLPSELRRFTGNFKGGHAIALAKARSPGAGPNMVRWMDPMGKPPTYEGVDVAYNKFADALMRADGLVRVTYGRHNAALAGGNEREPESSGSTMSSHMGETPPAFDPDSALIVTRGQLNEFVRVEKGTRFLNPTTLERVASAGDTGNFRVAGRTINGKFFGIWVNTRQVRGATGATLLLVEKAEVGDPFAG